MDSQCLNRYRSTPCFVCLEYRDNKGNPTCFKGVPSFPIVRCPDYRYESDVKKGDDGE